MQGPHKVLVIGEPGIGKTSLIRRYVDGIFNKHYSATLGVDFALKVVEWSPDVFIRLHLWDIAGQERFSSMTRVYFKQAMACVIIFDITRRATFNEVLKWKADLDSKARQPNGDALPCLLIANKADLPERDVSNEEIQQMCDTHGFIGWVETSAKENTNVEQAMRYLIKHIIALNNDDVEPPKQGDLHTPGRDAAPEQGGCCK